MSATVDFSRDVVLGMLSKGETGNEIMQILDVIASDSQEQTSDYGQGNGYDSIDF